MYKLCIQHVHVTNYVYIQGIEKHPHLTFDPCLPSESLYKFNRDDEEGEMCTERNIKPHYTCSAMWRCSGTIRSVRNVNTEKEKASQKLKRRATKKTGKQEINNEIHGKVNDRGIERRVDTFVQRRTERGDSSEK